MVHRGGCSFTFKANIAESAGASAILIINSDPGICTIIFCSFDAFFGFAAHLMFYCSQTSSIPHKYQFWDISVCTRFIACWSRSSVFLAVKVGMLIKLWFLQFVCYVTTFICVGNAKWFVFLVVYIIFSITVGCTKKNIRDKIKCVLRQISGKSKKCCSGNSVFLELLRIGDGCYYRKFSPCCTLWVLVVLWRIRWFGFSQGLGKSLSALCTRSWWDRITTPYPWKGIWRGKVT